MIQENPKDKPSHMEWLHNMTTAEVLLTDEVCGSQPPRWLPMVPTSWYFHPCVLSSHRIPGLVWQKWQYATPNLRLLKTLRLPSWLLSLREAIYHVARSHYCREVYMGRIGGLWSRASKNVKLANNQERELESRSCSPAKPAGPANTLSATSWETLTQNQLVKLLPDFWPSETM